MRYLVLLTFLLPAPTFAQSKHVSAYSYWESDDEFVDFPIETVNRLDFKTVSLLLNNTKFGDKIVCAVHSDNGILLSAKDVTTTNFTTIVILQDVIIGGVARCVDAEATKPTE